MGSGARRAEDLLPPSLILRDLPLFNVLKVQKSKRLRHNQVARMNYKISYHTISKEGRSTLAGFDTI